jgi:glucose-6-phosphate 1-epimerase
VTQEPVVRHDARFGTVVELRGEDGSHALVSLYGGQVLSWVTADGQEQLFMSSRATSNGPIRGGMPICFPQFAVLGPLPKHGYARTSVWRHHSNGRFVLDVRPGEWSGFDFPCSLVLDVMLGPHTLTVGLSVTNVGPTEFSFTAALHTYLCVADVGQMTVDGLTDDPIRFDGEVDLQVRGVDRPAIVSAEGVPLMLCAQTGFADAVVWNIGANKAPSLPDLGIGEHLHYACIEAAALDQVVLTAGSRWHGSQTLIRL